VHRVQHRLGPAGENVHGAFGDELCHELGLDTDLGLGNELGGLGLAAGAETEDDRRIPHHLHGVRKGRDPDAAADQQGSLDVGAKAVAERPEDTDRLTPLELAEHARGRTDRIDQKGQLAALGKADRKGPGHDVAGHVEHEELTREPGFERAALEPEQGV